MRRARWANACGCRNRTSRSAQPFLRRGSCGVTRISTTSCARSSGARCARARGRISSTPSWMSARSGTRGRASRYLVEPIIKEGKGGLRDLQTLYWIGKYVYQVDDAADLVEHCVFTKDKNKNNQKAE